MFVRKSDWRQEGEEPDYRFTLANERTFLAWIRTSLAILAGGVLLEQFAAKQDSKIEITIISISVCILSLILSIVAYRRWRANEIAMRHKSRLPISSDLLIFTIGLTIVSVSILGVLVWTIR